LLQTLLFNVLETFLCNICVHQYRVHPVPCGRVCIFIFYFLFYTSVWATQRHRRSYSVPNIILYYIIILCTQLYFLTCVYTKTDNTYDLACRNSSYNVRYSLLYSRLLTKTRFIWSNNYSHCVNIVISNKPLVIIIFLCFPYT